jgi:tripartite-type tricarboxylate transporter receptor subunit TctC
MYKTKRISKCFLAVTIVYTLSFPFPALSQTPFYTGKTITIVRGGGPGGSGDFQARALMPFLTKHIPGNPNVTMEMMPGAAGRRAANHLYNTAKPDGLTIGSAGGAVLPGPIIGLPGVKFDIDKFIYLGSTETGYPYIFYTQKEAGFDSLEKVRKASGMRVGAALGRPFALRHCASVHVCTTTQRSELCCRVYESGAECCNGTRRGGRENHQQYRRSFP